MTKPQAAVPKLTGTLVKYVLEALARLREWELTEQGWQAAQARVADIATAARAGDERTLAQAVAALAMLSPSRATRIGTEPTLPPPPTVMELVGETIDNLHGGGTRPDPANPTEQQDDDRPSA